MFLKPNPVTSLSRKLICTLPSPSRTDPPLQALRCHRLEVRLPLLRPTHAHAVALLIYFTMSPRLRPLLLLHYVTLLCMYAGMRMELQQRLQGGAAAGEEQEKVGLGCDA